MTVLKIMHLAAITEKVVNHLEGNGWSVDWCDVESALNYALKNVLPEEISKVILEEGYIYGDGVDDQSRSSIQKDVLSS